MGRLAGIARRDTKRAPMELLDTAEISIESGVAGDFRGRPGIRQVTLLSARAWQAACDELGTDIPWTTRRSNLYIEDIELPTSSGGIVAIGAVRLETTVEVEPCSRMDEQVSGLKVALIPDWRGGIACRVIEGGMITVGDRVSIIK